MAHSSAAAMTTGETVNYFYQDTNGQILRVLKPAEIKEEPSSSTSAAASYVAAKNAAATSTVTMSAYNQMSTNQPQYMRVQNNFNVQSTDNAQFTVVRPQSSTSRVFDEPYMKFSPVEQQKPQTQQQQAQPQQSIIKGKSKMSYNLPSGSNNSTSAPVQKKRKVEKGGKGLRHFSMKVCEKVKEKGTTNYNEVADELVREELESNSYDKATCDQKNIRRRVYDALNVLMAMHIISKDKKEIRWIGLPTNTAEQSATLEKENDERRERIQQKHQQLRELILQMVSFKSLIKRNREAECQGVVPTQTSSIKLPFIIMNTHKSTKVNCSVTNDKSEYIFKFNDKFEMHDDAEVLKRMGLLYGLDQGHCSPEDMERAKMLVPPNFEKYIEAYAKGKGAGLSDSNDLTEDPQMFAATDEDTMDELKSPDLLIDEDDEYMVNSDLD